MVRDLLTSEAVWGLSLAVTRRNGGSRKAWLSLPKGGYAMMEEGIEG